MFSETCSGTYTDYFSTFFILVSKEKYLRNLVSSLCSYKYFCLESVFYDFSVACELSLIRYFFIRPNSLQKFFSAVWHCSSRNKAVLRFKAPTHSPKSLHSAFSRYCFQLLLFISVLKWQEFKNIHIYICILFFSANFIKSRAVLSAEEPSKMCTQ